MFLTVVNLPLFLLQPSGMRRVKIIAVFCREWSIAELTPEDAEMLMVRVEPLIFQIALILSVLEQFVSFHDKLKLNTGWAKSRYIVINYTLCTYFWSTLYYVLLTAHQVGFIYKTKITSYCSLSMLSLVNRLCFWGWGTMDPYIEKYRAFHNALRDYKHL